MTCAMLQSSPPGHKAPGHVFWLLLGWYVIEGCLSKFRQGNKWDQEDLPTLRAGFFCWHQKEVAGKINTAAGLYKK